ncbi:type II toxin-antitoxin system RelE/ParE family toxin [Woodsholea maritima]|uniref:type II toxin-antitoxin system RelE/ParE family toxin n=1 Tax=Woodsholea maritima TaxID=240237 RepID=UPI00037BECEE|nr:type II toxin-antitoxin system RelE/ParE family toxin [Woodsholea maritima]
MTYRLSRAAEADLQALLDYGYAHYSAHHVDAYWQVLIDAFETLGRYPHLARLRRELNPHVRIHRCQAHIIIYMQDDGTPDILILRVRHHLEDWLSAS